MNAGSITQMPAAKSRPRSCDEGVAAVAGAVADLGGDAELGRPRLGAGGERVELAVEPLGLAAEDRRELPPSVVVQVRAGVVDLLGGVEQGAVVDPDGVGVLVLDDGAVHERAEVAQRLVVQVAGGDPLGDRLGELRGELVHVGELVGHRHRDLLARRPFGDAGADLLGQGELAAEVVRPLRRRCRGRRRQRRSGLVSRRPARACQQSSNCCCWSESVSSSRCWQCAWRRRISSGEGAWSSSSTIRLRTGSARPSMYSLPARPWLALAAR